MPYRATLVEHDGLWRVEEEMSRYEDQDDPLGSIAIPGDRTVTIISPDPVWDGRFGVAISQEDKIQQEEAAIDAWNIDGIELVRVRKTPRSRLFDPRHTPDCPVVPDSLGEIRTTKMMYVDDTIREHKDNWVEACPIPRKGRQRSIERCVEGLVQMSCQLGYQQVSIKGDNESTMKSLKKSFQQLRGTLGLRTLIEDSIPHGHASNRLVERAIQTVRRQGNALFRKQNLFCVTTTLCLVGLCVTVHGVSTDFTSVQQPATHLMRRSKAGLSLECLQPLVSAL